MIRCSDNSIYTGITNNIDKRMNEHFNKKKTGAKYTKSHDAKELLVVFSSHDKSLAASLEYYLKRLRKSEKENIVEGYKLNTYLKGKIDGRRYRRVQQQNTRVF